MRFALTSLRLAYSITSLKDNSKLRELDYSCSGKRWGEMTKDRDSDQDQMAPRTRDRTYDAA
jgi:hypothetical protein